MIGWMSQALDDSTLARTIYFIRIKSPFARRYNLFYPFICAFSAVLLYILAPIDPETWAKFSFSQKIAPLLSLLFPFYVASLAAVSTFSGSKEVDKAFPEDSQGALVTLAYRGRNGVVLPQRITQRHFISLLFAYCSVLSVLLLFSTGLAPFVDAGLQDRNEATIWWLSVSVLFVFLFFFFQMIVLTLLAVYYLGDKIHRRPEPSGDDVVLSVLSEAERAALPGRPPTRNDS